MTLDAAFTDEQRALRDVARDLFAEISSPEKLRARWDADEYDRSTWKRLAAVGLTGIGIEEELGGQGGARDALVLVAEEAGASCLSDPLLDTTYVAAPMLPDEWRKRVAAGEAMLRVVDPASPFVLDADAVDAVIVERDGAAVLVEASGIDPGSRIRVEDGTRRVFSATVDPASGTRLPFTYDVVRARAAAVTALELVGVCRNLVDQCVAYASVRRQFDAPIGSFQAVQHMLATMYLELESARGAARFAGRLAAADMVKGADARHASHVAKAAANRAHEMINRDALQLFGGIGFTWEHDLHLWLKRGLALAASFGSDRDHRRMLASLLFDREPADA